MFENCTVKYSAHNGENTHVKVIYPIDLDENGNEREDKRHKELDIPIDEANADYQEVLKWVAEGNTIEEAD
jgi:hypothetical protein